MIFIYNIVKCIKCYTILVYHKFFSKILIYLEKFNYGKDIFVLFCCGNIYLQLIVMRITIIDLYNEINIQ